MAALTNNIGLEVKLEIVARSEKVQRHIVGRAKSKLPPHSRRLVPCIGIKVKALDLPKRDLLFEASKNAITKFTNLVNAKAIVITVENSTGAPVVLSKHTRLSSVVDTETNYGKAMQNSRLRGKKSHGNTSC